VRPAQGVAGTVVTITGTGFTNGAQAVRFGDVAAPSFTVVSFSQISAVAPPHAEGIVDVTVSTASGTSSPTLAARYTYLPPPPTTPPTSTPPIVPPRGGADARGYRLAASDGGVFAFGDAVFFGSTGALRLARPVVGMASST
jgi:hypothetical protein